MNQGSFWLGLDKIFELVDKDVSNNRTITLRIDIWGDRCDQRGRCSNLADGYWFGEWGFAVGTIDNYQILSMIIYRLQMKQTIIDSI